MRPVNGPLMRSVAVHTPPAGDPWKNCVVGPKPVRLPAASTMPLDCTSTAVFRVDEEAGELVARIREPEAEAQGRFSGRHSELVGERLPGVAGRTSAGQVAGECAPGASDRHERTEGDRNAAVVAAAGPEVQPQTRVPGLSRGDRDLECAGLPAGARSAGGAAPAGEPCGASSGSWAGARRGRGPARLRSFPLRGASSRAS